MRCTGRCRERSGECQIVGCVWGVGGGVAGAQLPVLTGVGLLQLVSRAERLTFAELVRCQLLHFVKMLLVLDRCCLC
jgi:hypothetical protein